MARHRDLFRQKGKLWQNATNESFNGKFPDECLNMHGFSGIRPRKEATNVFSDSLPSW
jgi:hypothetical protein